jgi:hypothetical protein
VRLYSALAASAAPPTVVDAPTIVDKQEAIVGDVVINEVAWGGTLASASDEWLELYNTTQHTIPLEGWTLHASVNGPTITLEGVITPQAYFLLERTDDHTVNDIPADHIYTGDLHNSGETITLSDPQGHIIDTANQQGAGWPAGRGSPDYTSMERIDALGPDTATNWETYDGIIVVGHDAAGHPIRGTPRHHNTVAYTPLTLQKTGPAQARAGMTIPYTLTVHIGSHAYQALTVTHIAITDTLPTDTTFITHGILGSFTFSHPTPQMLVWKSDTLPPGITTTRITLQVKTSAEAIGDIINRATLDAHITSLGHVQDHGQWTTQLWNSTMLPQIRLYALHPGNYEGLSGESAALINTGATTVDLSGWCLDDALTSSTRACFPNTQPGAVAATAPSIAPGAIVWLAEDAEGFRLAWGFDADWAVATSTRPVAPLEGPWPGFTDDGEAVYLLAPDGDAFIVVDVLLYGHLDRWRSVETQDFASLPNWVGPPVPYPYAGYNRRGQVLYRKLHQATGSPVPDTDGAADWAQDPQDPLNGRKLRYPGWDLEAMSLPLNVAGPISITLAVAPEATFDCVTQYIAAAQDTLRIQGYTLGSPALYASLQQRLQAGVAITALLDHSPAGGMTDEEKWVAQQLHDPPQGNVFFMGKQAPRYRYQHAKFIVVDDRVALISTDNFGENSMPSDPKANGTMGHRGIMLTTDSLEIVAYLKALFRRDCDPAHHLDVTPYDASYAPPAAFSPLPATDWTTYTAVFSQPLSSIATDVRLLHAPEHGLRDHDGLLALINSTETGDAIDVMQLNEPITWTTGIGNVGQNPRITELVNAAARGVEVRVLLDAYYDDPVAAVRAPRSSENAATCLYLNQLPYPNLTCRLANITGLGIHAKLFLITVQGETYVNMGSFNGTETSHKLNREVAIQFVSETSDDGPSAYDTLKAVFAHDWARGHPPIAGFLYLPVVMRSYTYQPPPAYPLITEVMINPQGEDAGYEWIEVYYGGRDLYPLTLSLGDALATGDYGDGRYTFPPGAGLRTGQVIVIAACAPNFAAHYGFNPNYEWTACAPDVPDMRPVATALSLTNWDGFGLALGNTADEILFLDSIGSVVDSVAWGGEPRAGVLPFPLEVDSAFPAGATLKRYPVTSDNPDCEEAFYISYTPSPGYVSVTLDGVSPKSP